MKWVIGFSSPHDRDGFIYPRGAAGFLGPGTDGRDAGMRHVPGARNIQMTRTWSTPVISPSGSISDPTISLFQCHSICCSSFLLFFALLSLLTPSPLPSPISSLLAHAVASLRSSGRWFATRPLEGMTATATVAPPVSVPILSDCKTSLEHLIID